MEHPDEEKVEISGFGFNKVSLHGLKSLYFPRYQSGIINYVLKF